ncbi:MAG: DUF4070 domain-containing protein [Candidatus Aureabacteria bacterium]|nr:DUF4070 domain-containing protein [Candidatus Auribacterota bacterium]
MDIRKLSVTLINPSVGASLIGGSYNRDIRHGEHLSYSLSLATVAGVLADCGVSQVKIIDENLGESYLDSLQSDIIGITGFPSQKARILFLSEFFFLQNRIVILGGPFATIFPKGLHSICTSVFIGDCEKTLPRFLEDYKNSKIRKEYHQEPSTSPPVFHKPRYDIIKMKQYTFSCLQTTKGCPHDCEFCTVFLHFGRNVSTKPIELVIQELEEVYRIKGPSSFILCDDNSAADPVYFKNLLQAIIVFQEQKNYPFRFITEVTILIARDEALLELMARAGIYIVFIGIESPLEESLREAGKKMNLMVDMAGAIQKIQSYGICVDGASIVGFDHDDASIFDKHFNFFDRLNIPNIFCSLLYAAPKTHLFERLRKENRLIESPYCMGPARDSSELEFLTNIIPARMTQQELIEGYKKLVFRLYSFKNFGNRLIRYLQIPLKMNNETLINTTKHKGLSVIKCILLITWYHLVEEFPQSFLIYMRILYHAYKRKRLYIAFHHLVHFKQVHTYYYKHCSPTRTE